MTPARLLPPAIAASWILVPLLFGAERAPEGRDVVFLADGTRQAGVVTELGGCQVELATQSGSKKIWRKEIVRVEFDETRHRLEVEDTDVVVRQGGHRIRGTVEILDAGKRVRIQLPGGATAELPRSDVLRIIRRGEPVESDTSTYTAELGKRIDEAVGRLHGEAPVSPSRSSTVDEDRSFLAGCGIFAIEKVRKALAAAKPGTPGADALASVDRLYHLKEVVAPEIEEVDRNIYSILTGTDLRAKRDLLTLVFPRFVDESTPLAVFLALDTSEEPEVRAWSIDFLRRMQRNRELLDIYRQTTGREQLAAAIALGKNRILLGIPTLLEAMDMDIAEVRALASRHLVEFTGKDLDFRPGAAPEARKRALERWRAWWQENEGGLKLLAANVLRDQATEGPEREAAVKLWKDASADIEGGNYSAAETKLREARNVDPAFSRATISLAILLYTYMDRAKQAVDLLEDLKSSAYWARTAPEERQWAYLHLGHALRVCREPTRALEAYEQCRILNPESIQAAIGAGDAGFLVAVGDSPENADERKKRLQNCRQAYEAALGLLDKLSEGLTTVLPDRLPADFQPPYDRREYNRTILDLRQRYRRTRLEVVYKLAKVRAVLGEKKEAVLAIRGALQDPLLREEGGKQLQVTLRSFLAGMYEDLDQPLLALREYRTILDGLDPKQPDAIRGVERLRRQVTEEKERERERGRREDRS